MNGSQGRVRLLCGPNNSARAMHINRIMQSNPRAATLLVPTRRYAQRRVEEIILEGNLPGILGRSVTTFADFVDCLVRAEGLTPARVDDFQRRLLLQDALRRCLDKPSMQDLGQAAQTRGFLSHMTRIITQLKQAAVDPAQFRQAIGKTRTPNWLDAAVADVYEAYQSALLEAGVYDVPGLFWQANLICRQRRPRCLQNTHALLLDGFDDFTPSEFNLLVSLRPHVDLLVFALNCDTAPNRSDLYAASLRTMRRIKEEFDVPVEMFEPAAPETFTQYAAATIFWRDKPVPPADALLEDMEVVPCADAVQEVEMVGRRIKRLLLDEAVAPSQIALVYPSLAGVAGTVQSVFAEFGLPARILQNPPISESSVGAFATTLLEAITRWDRDQVVDVVASPWFTPGKECASAASTLACAASIIGGRTEWRRRLDHLAARLEKDHRDLAHLKRKPRLAQALHALVSCVDWLEQLDDAMPSKATTVDFIRVMRDLLRRIDVEGAVQAHPVQNVRDCESAALAALLEMLDTWAHCVDQETVPRAEFISQLQLALHDVTFALPQPRDGVLCMDAQDVRHLRFDYVFFAGVNEGVIPSAPRLNAIYSEHDIANLAEAGIALETRYARIEGEMLKFHHVLCSARRRLVISWRCTAANGHEAYCSPYITDLKELFPHRQIEARRPQSNEFVPPLTMAASLRDLRNAAFAPSGDVCLRERFAPIERAAAIERARNDFSPFSNYDGVLADAAVLQKIAGQFNARHLFSVDQLEMYATCPFQFFVDRVLHVKQTEAPVAAFDPKVRGGIIHFVLEQFHSRYRGIPAAAVPVDDARAAIEDLIDQAFEARGWRSVNAPPAVVNVEKRYVRTLLNRYLENERRACETDWKPQHFEVAFGHDVEGGLNAYDAYELALPDGSALFSGRVDRIDVHAESFDSARIIDYKTGDVPPAKDLAEGRSLQLALYALALEDVLLPGTTCDEAVFVSISKKNRRRLKREDTSGKRDEIAALVHAYISGIRACCYPPAPGDAKSACTYCAAGRTCRYEKARVERKDQRP